MLAVFGLAKRRTVYVLLSGNGSESGQRHLSSKRKNTDKDAELV